MSSLFVFSPVSLINSLHVFPTRSVSRNVDKIKLKQTSIFSGGPTVSIPKTHKPPAHPVRFSQLTRGKYVAEFTGGYIACVVAIMYLHLTTYSLFFGSFQKEAANTDISVPPPYAARIMLTGLFA